MKIVSYLFVLLAAVFASFTTAKHTTTVKDYFNLPGPIAFNKSNFSLSWSAHPTGNYYKQEYLPAGEKSESYSKMIMLEAVVGDIILKDVVKAKMNELDQRKKIDPLVNYQVIQNPKNGEYLLDFVISQSTGGKASIAEWNAYRYTPLTDKSGKKGVVLFAYSRRGYGDAVPNFLKSLKTERVNDINALAAYAVPEIKIKAD